MELKQLRLFLAVAEELNYTRAAQRVNIAQPALSQQILNLENSLGVTLFSRNKRMVGLTQAGEELVTHARRVLNAASEASAAVGAVKDGSARCIQRSIRYFPLSSPNSALRTLISKSASRK
jgi:DNA-binding transcriptional LysR family regulator